MSIWRNFGLRKCFQFLFHKFFYRWMLSLRSFTGEGCLVRVDSEFRGDRRRSYCGDIRSGRGRQKGWFRQSKSTRLSRTSRSALALVRKSSWRSRIASFLRLRRNFDWNSPVKKILVTLETDDILGQTLKSFHSSSTGFKVPLTHAMNVKSATAIATFIIETVFCSRLKGLKRSSKVIKRDQANQWKFSDLFNLIFEWALTLQPLRELE